MRIRSTAAIVLAGLALAGCDQGAKAPAETPAPKPAPPNWVYEDIEDTMRGGTAHVACLKSENEARLSPPYQSQRLELCVVHAADKDIRVTLRLPEDGQFVCGPQGCMVDARYGSEPMIQWDGSHPADGAQHTLIFISSTTITYKLITPTRLQLQPTFYRDGSQVIRFPAVALDRGRMALPPTEVEAIVDHHAPRKP